MHEVDHRFTVSGYVRDKEGRPLGNARVYVKDLRDSKIDAVTGYADSSGHYKAVIHLHNENAGDPIQVTALEDKLGFQEAKKVQAEFDPKDLTSERQVKVDFGLVPEGAQQPEEQNYRWWYILGGALVSGAIGLAIFRSRRRHAKVGPKRRGKKR